VLWVTGKEVGTNYDPWPQAFPVLGCYSIGIWPSGGSSAIRRLGWNRRQLQFDGIVITLI